MTSSLYALKEGSSRLTCCGVSSTPGKNLPEPFEEYGLPKGERLNEIITQSWNRLQKHWAVFPLLSEYSLALEHMLLDEALGVILIMKPNRYVGEPENGAPFSASPFLRFTPFTFVGGWVGEEAVALGLYCYLRNPKDYAKTVIRAANTNGDSDSIACIAGSISGAYLGIDAIPSDGVRRIEKPDYLAGLAIRLEAKKGLFDVEQQRDFE
jgi:hypothetical protein